MASTNVPRGHKANSLEALIAPSGVASIARVAARKQTRIGGNQFFKELCSGVLCKRRGHVLMRDIVARVSASSDSYDSCSP